VKVAVLENLCSPYIDRCLFHKKTRAVLPKDISLNIYDIYLRDLNKTIFEEIRVRHHPRISENRTYPPSPLLVADVAAVCLPLKVTFVFI